MLIKCKICSNDFVQKTYNQLYCWSKECRKKVKYLSYKKDYEKHKERCIGNAKKPRYTKECDFCNKEFRTYSKIIITCSDKCYRERMARNRLWEWNPSYRNWAYTKESDKKIHKKWDRLFQKMCREMNEQMIEKYWYRFCECCWVNQSLRWEHHHIVFRSEKPGHEFLHSKENTIHLCIKCHNEYHKNKSKRDSLMKERWLDKIFWIFVE